MTPTDSKPHEISAESKLSPDAKRSCEHKHAALQFSLFSLFELTTVAAIAAALVAGKGWGTLVLSTGMTLAWFNVRGSFAGWQTPRPQCWLFGAAGVLFVVSLCLPALVVFGDVYGWAAAFTIANEEWKGITDWLAVDNRSLTEDISRILAFVWITLMNGANLSMLLSPLTLLRLRRGKGEWLANGQAITSVAAWFVLFDSNDFLVGSYVWCASMMLPLIARRMTWCVFIAMFATALIFCVVIWLEKLHL
jgi:hypothetical protein